MSDQSGDAHKSAKANAKAAQAYAKATRPWYKKKRWWAAGVLLVLVGGGLLGGGGDTDTTATDDSSGQSTDNDKKAAASSPEKAEATKEAESTTAKTTKIQAVALLKAFEDNEAAADARFNGKVLEVTGKVSKIDTEVLDPDQYVVMVNGGGDFEFLTVDCDDQSSDAVVNLTKGQDITVVGEFEDGGDLGVNLDDCRVK